MHSRYSLDKTDFMKWLLLLSLFSNHIIPPGKLILFDMQLKRPVSITEDFTDGDLFKGYFPVYASDVSSLKEACFKAGKLIDTNTRCNTTDTVFAAHTMMIIHCFCQGKKAVTVMLITSMPGKRIAYHLSENEENLRATQVKLAELSGYLNKEMALEQKPQL
jgi:hypothetical protein